MTIWIDAQLPPALAPWIKGRFQIEARAVRDFSLRHAKDHMIHRAAREVGVICYGSGVATPRTPASGMILLGMTHTVQFAFAAEVLG